MADSDEKDKTAEVLPEKPAEPTAMVVRTASGGTRIVRKGEDGKFVGNPRKPATKKDAQEVMAEFLTSKWEKGRDGKMCKRDKTRLLEQMEAMHDMALNKDPKAAPAAVKAAELCWVYLWGKPSASDKDRAALEISGVKYVVIQPPANMMNPQIVEASENKPPTKPSFIDDVTFLPPDRDKE